MNPLVDSLVKCCWTWNTVTLCARAVKKMTSSRQLSISMEFVAVKCYWIFLTGSEVIGTHTQHTPHNGTSLISLGFSHVANMGSSFGLICFLERLPSPSVSSFEVSPADLWRHFSSSHWGTGTRVTSLPPPWSPLFASQGSPRWIRSPLPGSPCRRGVGSSLSHRCLLPPQRAQGCSRVPG